MASVILAIAVSVVTGQAWGQGWEDQFPPKEGLELVSVS